MADKSTRLILAALSRAVAEPAGLPLFAAKATPGLFPPTAAARQAAQRCRDDGFLHLVNGENGNRPARECFALTDKGRSWLLHQSSPRQVLEDFVRVLEERQRQAGELVAAARQVSASLDSLKAAVEQLRPLAHQPTRNGQIHHQAPLVAMRAESAVPSPDLAAGIVSHVEQWHATAPGDCPLPELYRRLQAAHPDLSIGYFHDGLRALHDGHRVYLHPWTGPLYELPEPPFALLIGHEIAYYASTRT